jgi:hypothetical protein
MKIIDRNLQESELSAYLDVEVEKVFVPSLRFYRGWRCMIVLAVAVVAARPASFLQPFYNQ